MLSTTSVFRFFKKSFFDPFAALLRCFDEKGLGGNIKTRTTVKVVFLNLITKNMRSIERRFKSILKKNPYLSTHSAFALAVDGQNFSRPMLHHWFNKLVDKEDYDPKDKKEVLAYIVSLSKKLEDERNMPEDNRK
jgi:hypothetical protein